MVQDNGSVVAKNCLVWGLGLLFLFLLAGPAGAEEEAAEEDLEVELFFAPAETVQSAARHVQPLAHSPSAMTVLTREDIEASGARSLPEVLRLVPNMDVDMVKPLWYAVGVRGETSEASDSLLLLIDDRDVTFELFGAPLWTVQPFSLDDVERIEIIRGPGSALYGANAYAGVVQVFTRRPGEGPTASASIRGGEHGALEISGRWSGRAGPVSLSASTGVTRQDLWTGRDISGIDALRGRLQANLDLESAGKLLFEGGSYHTTGKLHADVGEVDLRDLLDLYGKLRYRLGDFSLQAVYDHVSVESDLGLNLYSSLLDQKLAELPPIDGSVDKVSLLAGHAVEVFYNRLSYGVEYVYNLYHADAFYDPDHDEHRVGVYLQDEFDLAGVVNDLTDAEMPPLIVTAGLRYDHNSVTRYELSPRAAVIFAPSDEHSFRFGYAHAFLKPTFFESSLDIKLHDIHGYGFNRLNVANPDLENQTLDSLEIGYSGNFLSGHLAVKLDFAYNWYRNLIGFSYDPAQMNYIEIGGLRIPDLNGPGIGFSNASSGDNGHDVELQIVAHPSQQTRLFVTLGYRQIFSDQKKHISVGEPIWRASAGADLGRISGWSLSVRAFFTSSYQRASGNPDGVLEPMIHVQLPASWFLNARLAYEFSCGPITLEAGLEGFNLLDFRFRELGGFSRAPLTDGQPGNDYGGERLGRRVVLFIQGEI